MSVCGKSESIVELEWFTDGMDGPSMMQFRHVAAFERSGARPWSILILASEWALRVLLPRVLLPAAKCGER